jgi:addiction module HigA family antidote
MIVSFKCTDTESLFRKGKTRVWSSILSVVERKLVMLDAATSLLDLRSPPGNRLEALGGDRNGHTAYVSTPNGVFALSGEVVARRTLKSSITTEVTHMTKNGMRPVHPGEILKEEYLEPLGLTSAALARALSVSTPTINDIVLQRRGVSADVALRLAACLDTTPEFWLNLQLTYDLRKTEIERGSAIKAQVQRLSHCA